ncbi:MAG TPA: HEAT repeat domain-containing protein [Gemmataceae bacterium]|nr:HEAT repeat domain-containing protein [Gemmataceae bacterium]
MSNVKLVVLAAGLSLLAGACGKDKQDSYSVESLTESLKDSNPDTRHQAARALGRLGPKAKPAVPGLIEALKDPDKTVRIGAIYALADMGPDAAEAIPPLREAARDRDKEISKGAEYALKQIQGRR